MTTPDHPRPPKRHLLRRILLTASMILGMGFLISGISLPFATDIYVPKQFGGRWGMGAMIFAAGAILYYGGIYLDRSGGSGKSE